MATSKINKIAVLERAIKNIKNDKNYRDGIQFYSEREKGFVYCEPDDRPFLFDFDSYNFKVANYTSSGSVSIPKPIDSFNYEDDLYIPSPHKEAFYCVKGGDFAKNFQLGALKYSTKEEAIEASKALYGVKPFPEELEGIFD